MFIEAKAEPIDQRSFKSAMFGGLIWRSWRSANLSTICFY